MRDKKYIWALLSVYFAYLTHGIQAIVISQNSANFQQQWGVDAGGISGVIAWTGLGKFLSVWICGEISDKIGRKIMIVIIFVMAAIITPPDVVSQVMVAIPMIGLYELSIGLSSLVARRRKENEDTADDD